MSTEDRINIILKKRSIRLRKTSVDATITKID